MTAVEMIEAQLRDPFRIGLVIMLVVTMYRTRAATGVLVPLAAGAVFIAVLIPSTMQQGTAPLMPQILAGLVSNAILLAAVMLVAVLIRRFLPPR